MGHDFMKDAYMLLLTHPRRTTDDLEGAPEEGLAPAPTFVAELGAGMSARIRYPVRHKYRLAE